MKTEAEIRERVAFRKKNIAYWKKHGFEREEQFDNENRLAELEWVLNEN